MTSKELVYQALAFQPVPRVPYGVGFTVAAREKFCSWAQGRSWYDRIDNDVTSTPVLRMQFGVCGPHGKYEDEFGVVWDRHIDKDIGVPESRLTMENLSSYRFPDPRAAGRFDQLKAGIDANPDKFHLMALDFALYERAWSLRGMANLLEDFVEHEDFVGELLDKILLFNLDVIEAGIEACPQIDGVYFGDDFGSQMGLMMGAPRWRKLLKPRLAKQYGAVKAAGKKVFIHSCGRVQEILDDLVEIGVDCFNPFQPEVMDVFDIHKRYHGRLAFWGGVSTQQTLPYGSVEEVRQQVGRLLDMGRKGGYIIAPAHSIPEDAKVENIAAMLEMIFHQGGC